MQVVCAIIITHQKLLICKRGKQQSNAGLWEFPGGKVKPGELLTHAIQREIMEELNISVEPIKQLPSFFSKQGPKQLELIPFICNSFNGEIYVQEHAAIAYCGLNQLSNYSFTPADEYLCNYLVNNQQILKL